MIITLQQRAVDRFGAMAVCNKAQQYEMWHIELSSDPAGIAHRSLAFQRPRD